jgi:hypothetical protein
VPADDSAPLQYHTSSRHRRCRGRPRIDVIATEPSAESNNRLVSMDSGKVCFRWKDYRDDNRQKTMTLPAEAFIRRFLIHVLPVALTGHGCPSWRTPADT